MQCVHILPLGQWLSCLTSKCECLPVVKDISSGQMSICSLAMWLSLTHLYHREGQLCEVHVTRWVSVHVMWHMEISSYPAEVDAMLLAGQVIIWQDRASVCIWTPP